MAKKSIKITYYNRNEKDSIYRNFTFKENTFK